MSSALASLDLCREREGRVEIWTPQLSTGLPFEEDVGLLQDSVEADCELELLGNGSLKRALIPSLAMYRKTLGACHNCP